MTSEDSEVKWFPFWLTIFWPLKIEIYVYDDCIILNDTSVDETQLVFQKKNVEILSSLPIKNQENKDFNKSLERLVFSIFDKNMVIKTNYISSNNFPGMWSLKDLPTAIYQY